MPQNKESPLQREFEYYLANQPALVKQYNGRYVVIKDQRVIADYGDEATAVYDTQKTHPLGTFLVQKVGPGRDAYTQTFHSRVVFAN